MEGITSRAKIVIFFANTYNMLNERQEQLKGCTVHYMFWGEDGEKLMEQSEWDVGKPVGVQRAKCSIDYDLRVKIPIAPALYEGEFMMAVGGDGKPVLKLLDVAYVSNISIQPKVIPGIMVPGMIQPAAEEKAKEPVADDKAKASASSK